MAQRIGGLVLALAIAAASGFAALIGSLWGFTLKCDDSCSTPPPWRNDPNARQWDALGATAIALFVCALLFLAALALRRRLVAVAPLVGWALLAGTFLTLFRDSGLTSHTGRGWAGLTVFVLAGLAAVGLTASRR